MKNKIKVVCSSLLCLMLAAGSLSSCGKSDKPASFTWTGMTNVTVAAGDAYDLMSGISVKDSKGADITSEVIVLTLEDNENILNDLGIYDDFEDFDYNITGAYTVYYMVTSGKTTEIRSRQVTVSQQHNVANGDFAVTSDDGFYNWTSDTPGGHATLEKVTENGVQKPKFNISDIGTSWYSLQYISSCNLKEGETYKITVNAKSSNGKSVAFGFEDVGNNYAMMQGLTAYTLADSYADYVSYYTADADYTNAKAVLYFGYILEEDTSVAYDLTIDSIKIEKVQKCETVTFEGVDDIVFSSETDELKAFISNPKAGVTASEGNIDLTDSITVMGNVSEKVMERTNFTLVYVIEKENGSSAIVYRTVTVFPGENSFTALDTETLENSSVFGGGASMYLI